MAKITRLHKIIQVLAYRSLALYLFHRQIYQFVMVIYSYFDLQVTIYTAYLLMLPLAILGAYVIQLLYDKAVSKFKTA